MDHNLTLITTIAAGFGGALVLGFIAEKLRLAVQTIAVPVNGSTLHVTISVGVAEAGPACADVATLLAQADVAMYHAKSNGRNRVHSNSAQVPGDVACQQSCLAQLEADAR